MNTHVVPATSRPFIRTRFHPKRPEQLLKPKVRFKSPYGNLPKFVHRRINKYNIFLEGLTTLLLLKFLYRRSTSVRPSVTLPGSYHRPISTVASTSLSGCILNDCLTYTLNVFFSSVIVERIKSELIDIPFTKG